MSYTGFVFGHVRAIKWAKALGETELEANIRAKVLEIYKEDKAAINIFTLAIAAIMGDSEQVAIIRSIMDSRGDLQIGKWTK